MLTGPLLIEDAGETTKPADNTQEADPLHATPAASGNKSEEVEHHLQSKRMSAEKNKENCQVKSREAKPGCKSSFSAHVFPHWELTPHSCHLAV